MHTTLQQQKDYLKMPFGGEAAGLASSTSCDASKFSSWQNIHLSLCVEPDTQRWMPEATYNLKLSCLVFTYL